MDTIKGIKVSDKALGQKKHFQEPMILNVDKSTVSSNVHEALKLYPKHALPVPVKLIEVKKEIQKGFYKQRLSMKREEERKEAGETEEEAEKNDAEAHKLIDRESNTINFNNLRPTDLPSNKQIGAPPIASNKVEIKMAGIEAELVQVTMEYIKNNCDSEGLPKETNLTEKEREGVKEILAMLKEGDKVVSETDKSSKLELNSLEGYTEMERPHVEKDKAVTTKEVNAIEHLMNGHTYQLCRILGVCTAWDDGKRVKGAMTNKNLPPPCLKLCHKDHKPDQSAQPIYGASRSHNGQASHLLSLILNQVAQVYDQDYTECRSTEEMIANMEDKVNSRNEIKNLFVGSTDVRALYPSLLHETTTKIVVKVFFETNIKLEGIDWNQAGKYLAINMSKSEITKLGLEDLVSTRTKSGGAFPCNTTAEVMGKLFREDEEEVISLFHPPHRRPANTQEEKKVLAEVLKIAILAVLKNHTYQFGGEVRLQEEGGPIGLELAGALARVVMLWWDRKFLSLATANNLILFLYLRYIDDGNLAGEHLPPGSRWLVGPWAGGLGGRMVVREELVEEDRLLQADQRSMEEFRKMGNSILPMIQLEDDCPSKKADRKLPILDLKVWVRDVEVEVEGERVTRPKLYYHYYRKPMSNWLLIPARSAMSSSVKRTAITQYGLRILRNTKFELEWEIVAELLSEFSERLRDSGYSERFRVEVMKSILEGWRKMVEEQRKGGRPINRPRIWNQEEREDCKLKKKTSWYRAGGYSTVIFCTYTPNSVLAKRWREVEERGAATRGWRYRVVELGRWSIRSSVCRFPWGVPCTDAEKCLVCSTGGRGPCTRPGCTYQIQCLACQEQGPDIVPQEEERRPGQGTQEVP